MDTNWTPEQIQAAKVANATGFLNQRIHDAERTPEQAQSDLKVALAYNEKVASQIPRVVEIVRSHLKSARAAA
jgi:hypothetical protein